MGGSIGSNDFFRQHADVIREVARLDAAERAMTTADQTIINLAITLAAQRAKNRKDKP